MADINLSGGDYWGHGPDVVTGGQLPTLGAQAGPKTADPALLGPNFSGPLPASFGGQVQQGAAPPSSENASIVYTDQSGRGYNPRELAANSGTLLQDPANARVR